MIRKLQTVHLFLREIRSFFEFLNRRNRDARALTFYSEHAAYGKFFEDLIGKILGRSELKMCYVTSDPNDPFFKQRSDRFPVFYVDKLLPLLFPLLDSKAVVMTAPDLHQCRIQRSLRGARHFYLFHALVSTHVQYRKGAFDHYDTIFCAGPHHREEIRLNEKVYGLKRKELVETGYPLLDRLYAEHQEYLKQNPPPEDGALRCLIAPSWSPQNIFDTCLEKMTEVLFGKGCEVTIRPHPEYVKRKPKQWAQLKESLKHRPRVRFEEPPVSEASLHRADVLVTDWSGIALEYAFATERPVLFIDTPRKISNPEYQRIGIEALEMRLRNRIGKTLPLGSVDRIFEAVSELIKERARYRQAILEARQASVCHFGVSAEKTADFLIDFLQGKKEAAVVGADLVSARYPQAGTRPAPTLRANNRP